jgi:hypothetical protein
MDRRFTSNTLTVLQEEHLYTKNAGTLEALNSLLRHILGSRGKSGITATQRGKD